MPDPTLSARYTEMAKLMVVTENRRGCLVYERGKAALALARLPAVARGRPDGRGDVFAASFAAQYQQTGNPRASADFANAARVVRPGEARLAQASPLPRPSPIGSSAGSGVERRRMPARIITVANQKGGVGKTTTAVSLGAELAGRFRVLLIDLDPQANATSSLGLADPSRERSTYDVLLGEPAWRRSSHDGIAGLDLAPARPGAGRGAGRAGGPAGARASAGACPLTAAGTRQWPAECRVRLVLIDTPPSLGLLTLNALAASDHVLVPVQSEYLALEGLGQLVETLELVRSSLNPRLGLVGILLTMLDARTNLSDAGERRGPPPLPGRDLPGGDPALGSA